MARRDIDEDLLVEDHEDEEDDDLGLEPDADFEDDLDEDDLGDGGDDPEGDEPDEEEDDDDVELDFASQPDPVTAEIETRAEPVKDTQEFVCSRCHLVKARSQLADAERQLCRDCV